MYEILIFPLKTGNGYLKSIANYELHFIPSIRFLQIKSFSFASHFFRSLPCFPSFFHFKMRNGFRAPAPGRKSAHVNSDNEKGHMPPSSHPNIYKQNCSLFFSDRSLFQRTKARKEKIKRQKQIFPCNSSPKNRLSQDRSSSVYNGNGKGKYRIIILGTPPSENKSSQLGVYGCVLNRKRNGSLRLRKF